MPILYKGITAVLALTGCVSLLITHEMNLIMSAGGIALIPGYYRFLRGGLHAPKQAIGLFSTITLFVFVIDAFRISGDMFLSVAHLTISFQAIKSFDLKEPWDHLQVYFVSLLQLIIASELTRSLAFGVVFIIFMIVLVTAMVLSHFLKEGALGKVGLRRPVAAIVILTLVCTTFFFVALPRTPQRFIGKSHYRGIKTVGFSERVDFGSFGDVKLDETVVMRIEMDKEVKPPYYWRGISMDYFDGISWRNTTKEKNRIAKHGDEFQLFPFTGNTAVEQQIFLEPIDSDVIFGLSRIASVRADARFLAADSDMGLSMPGKFLRRMRYTVTSVLSSRFEGRKEQKYLQVPSGMDRVVGLAKGITEQAATEEEKAVIIEDYLKRNFAYSLITSPPPAGTSVIEHFLFSSRRGYCEHYASSMAMMLRGIGIPARVVNGFFGGERNDFGNYLIVRQSNAHAWIEALIDSEWRRFDPTPAIVAQARSPLSLLLDSLRLQWTRYVVAFSIDDQKEIVKSLAIPFRLNQLPPIAVSRLMAAGAAAAAVAVCLILMVMLKRHRSNTYGFVTGSYIEVKDLMRKRGIAVTDAMTSGDMKQAVSGLSFEHDLTAFLDLYEGHRFGNKEMDHAHKKQYCDLLRRIKKHKTRRG